MIGKNLKKLKLNTTATAEKYMGYSLAITAYRQTCNRSHRAKDNEHRQTSKLRGPSNSSIRELFNTIYSIKSLFLFEVSSFCLEVLYTKIFSYKKLHFI